MPLVLTNFLNRITMYRLILYFLIFLLTIATLESLLGVLPYKPIDILLTTLILVTTAVITNQVFAKILKAYTNPESTLITALILALIVGPADPLTNTPLLLTAAALAIASKYVLAFKKRHLANPAAAGVLFSALIIQQGASWWVGNIQMLLFVALGGFLILAKIKRFTLVLVFLTTYFVLAAFFGINPLTVLAFSPIVFFATVMLVEPLTSPVETNKQIAYAAAVAILLLLFQQSLKVGYTLELALLAGNVFSFFTSTPFRLSLAFQKRRQIAKDTFAFYFTSDKAFNFIPGQFLHWTLPHKNPDARGVRRFFTICSSPTQKELMIAVKIPDRNPSSFKRALLNLKEGELAVAIDPSGEFVLPKDASAPLAFIAGGIGITPFISMIGFLIDKKQTRDMVLLYSNSTEEEVAFKDFLEKAKKVGLKTIYVITSKDGYIDAQMIKRQVPDWKERIFYVSGPQPMVEIFKDMLAKMGVRKIKTDFFPGYSEKHQK